MKTKILVILLLPLLLASFLSVGYSQLSDSSIISMSGSDWSLKVDGVLQSSIDSRNTPYMTSKSATEKELFLQLASFEDCKSGVVQFKVDMQGLTAYKQLPLDKELNVKEYSFVNATHALNGSQVLVYRPIEVVNSFALFDDDGRKQMHISASKLVDAGGASVWCDSTLEGGLLTVVLPLEWLEVAKFPVVLDPTIGKTDVGGSTTSSAMRGLKLNFTEGSGHINLASLYVGASGSPVVKCGLFTYVADNDAGSYIDQTEVKTIASSASWINMSFSSPPAVNDETSYFIVWFSNTTVSFYYDTGGSVGFSVTSTPTYPNWADPLTGEASSTASTSFYIDYSLDSEPTPTPTPSPSPSPSPTPEGATATPFPEGAMDDTDWWISILVLLLIIINIFLMMLPFALVRFTFGILSLFLCMLALSYQIPLSPYLQTAGLLISALAMLFSVRARE